MKKLYKHEIVGLGDPWRTEKAWEGTRYEVSCLGEYDKKQKYYHRVRKLYRESDMVAIAAVNSLDGYMGSWWSVRSFISDNTDINPELISRAIKNLQKQIESKQKEIKILEYNSLALQYNMEFVVEGSNMYDER